MELRPGYKQTEVGAIPEDWEIFAIGQALRLINGCAFKPEDWKGQGIPIIRIQNLNDCACPFNYCDTQVEERYHVSAGDILFAWSGTTGTSFGARVWTGPNGVLNQHIFKVLADETKLTRYYSFLILQRVQENIEKKAHGFKSSFVHVKKSDLTKIQLPVPPLPEQHAIAAVLSDVDALIDSLDKLIAKKRDIKRATMQQLLTGKHRLPGFQQKTGFKQTDRGVIPEDWITLHISEISQNIIDYRGRTPRKLGMEWGGGDIPALSAKNVKMGYIDFQEETYLGSEDLYKRWMTNGDPKKDDIVVTMEAPLGNVALIPDDRKYILSQRTILLQVNPDKACSQYLLQLMSSRSFQNLLSENSTGSTATGIQRKRFEILEVPLPPTLEQFAIATVLSDMDAEITALEARRDKTKLLKQGMMQELLTGRIRLV